MGNKQNKQKKQKGNQEQANNEVQEPQRSKSAEPQKGSSQNNSIYGVKITPPLDPIQQMRKSQMNSTNMLNQSQMNRSAITPPPRMAQSKYGGPITNLKLQDQQVGQSMIQHQQQQRSELNRSYVNSISDRANIGRSQRNVILNQNNSRLDLSMRVEQKRSVSPNKLLPPKEEVSVMLSNIRKKEILQTREKEYAIKKLQEFSKCLNFVEIYANGLNFFDVESQLNQQTNLILNLNNYDTFLQLRNESQQEIQRMVQNGETNTEKFNEKQKLYERAVAILKTIDSLKKEERLYSDAIDYTSLIRERDYRNREQSLENILKQDISQLSQNQYGEHHKLNSHPNIQLKEMLAEVEPIQKEEKQQEIQQNPIQTNNNNNVINRIKNTDSAYSSSFKSSSAKDRQLGIQSQYGSVQQKQQIQGAGPQQEVDGRQAGPEQQQYVFSLHSNVKNPMTSTIKNNLQENDYNNHHQHSQSSRSRSDNETPLSPFQQSQPTPIQSNRLQTENYPQQSQQQRDMTNQQQMMISSNQELPHFQIQQSQSQKQFARNNNFYEQNAPEFSNPTSNRTSPDIDNRQQNQNQYMSNYSHQQGYQSDLARPVTAPPNQTQQQQQLQLQQQQQQQQQEQLYYQQQQNQLDSEQKPFRKQWFNQNENFQQIPTIPQQHQQNMVEETGRFQTNQMRNQLQQQQEQNFNDQNQYQAIPHSQSSVQLSNPQLIQQQNNTNVNQYNQYNQDNQQMQMQYQQQQQGGNNFIPPANPRSLTPTPTSVATTPQGNQYGQQNQQFVQTANQQQYQQSQVSQQQQAPATARNIRKEIEIALANKQRRNSLQQSDIQTMKHSMNPNQPMKESYITHFDGSHQLPYQQNNQTQQYQYYEDQHPQTPVNTSQMNESYLSKSNVNVYIEKERLQKKGNDILVYRNVKLNKVKAAHTNQASQNNGMARKGSKIIQINKSNNNNTMKNSVASNNYNSNPGNNYLQQHLNKVANQKQVYKPLNASSTQNVVQDQFHMYMNQQQQLQDQNLFNNVSAINYPPNTNNNENYENSFLSNNSNILLNDQSLLENYNINKMHHCEANHEHERYKTPKKYQAIESHYSPNNLQFYLNKDHRSYSNNQKWVQEKVEIDKTNNASKRTFWDRKPDTEIRTQTKDNQIKSKLTNQAKNLESGINDMQKSLALYKSSNEKIYKSTIEIPTVGKNQSTQGSEKKPLHMKFDLKSIHDAKKNKQEQMNPIFAKHMQQNNEGSVSDRSHYAQIFPRDFDTIKNVQLRDQNLQNIHQEVIDLSKRLQNKGNQNNAIKSSNNLSDNNEDQRNKVVYQTIGMPTSNNAFYQPNWIQVNKNVQQQSNHPSHQQSQDMSQDQSQRDAREQEQQVNYISKQESPEPYQKQQYQPQQESENKAMSQFQKQRQQFYQQKDIQSQQGESDSYYLQYPQQYQIPEQNQNMVTQRVPAQPPKNNNQLQIPNQSNQITVIHKSGGSRTQLDLNQFDQSAEMDALKKELLS